TVLAVPRVAGRADSRLAPRRPGSPRALARAEWYAAGGGERARARIRQLDRDGRTTLAGGWNGRPFVFPVDGGTMRVRLDDASACFNLNSVVEGAPNQWVRREAGVRQYIALLLALDFTPARAAAMADALVDWIDRDQVPGPAGAEDPA